MAAKPKTKPIRLTEEAVRKAPAPAKYDRLIYDVEVTGFGVRIFAPTNQNPAGQRSFFLSYWRNGTERRYRIGKFPDWSVLEARAEAKRLRKGVDRGIDPADERRIRRDAATVRELAERYKAEHLPGKSAKSQHDDWAMIENYILPFKPTTRSPKMGERKVTEIHSGDIKALHRRVTEDGHPTGANRVLAVASKMFSLALQPQAGEEKPWRDATLGNPCSGVKRNSEEGRQRFFSEAEIAAISDALNEYSSGSAANCVKFIMLTGCRPGEAMAATWAQVDDEPGYWIKPALTTKQRKVHKLPLAPAALELLDRMRADRAKQRGGGKWLFPGQVEGQPIQQLRTVWDFVRERVDGVANDRLYDLRHSFASIGIAGGYSLAIIGKLLGHTQARTTQIYSHLADDAVRAAAAKIGGTISNAGKGGRERLRSIKGGGAA